MTTKVAEAKVYARTSAQTYGVRLPNGYSSVTVQGPKESLIPKNITEIVAAWSDWRMAADRTSYRFPKVEQILRKPESDNKDDEEDPDVSMYKKACSDKDRFFNNYCAAMTATGLKVSTS